ALSRLIRVPASDFVQEEKGIERDGGERIGDRVPHRRRVEPAPPTRPRVREAGKVPTCSTPLCFASRVLCFYQTAASLVGSKGLSGLQVVVYFTSSWCGPCRMIAPVFADLANKFTDAIFLRVDVNELKRVALDCAIETLPTFIFLRQGNIVDRVVGARKDVLPKKIELHMRK
ncbi:hypothetical protein BHE74_00020756, partial [Ensete ventricosum]